MQPQIATVDEVAAYLKISSSTIRRLVNRGELPYFRVGRNLRFNLARIDDWRLAQQPSARDLRYYGLG